ncbi:MAG: YihY/virulence factor BrkB family protein [Chthoniobacterales bacterium]
MNDNLPATASVELPYLKGDGVFSRLKATVILTWLNFCETEVEQRAAAFAYYVFLSLIPLLALIIAVGSFFLKRIFFNNNLEDINQMIGYIIPLNKVDLDYINEFIGNLEHARNGVGIIAFLILVWASLRFFQSLVMAVNRAWHTVPNPWWHVPLKNLLMVAVLCSAVIFGIIAPAIIQSIRQFASTYFASTYFPAFALSPILLTLDMCRYAVGSVVLFYCFSVLYMIAPRIRVKFSQIWVSALLVTILLQVVQVVFVKYLSKILTYNAIYGTVGAFMFLLVWIYTSGVIIIAGACLSSASTQVREALKNAQSPAIPSS